MSTRDIMHDLINYPAASSGEYNPKGFKNGQGQAVRLPKEYRFEGNEVYVKKMGDIVLLVPKDKPWGTLCKQPRPVH